MFLSLVSVFKFMLSHKMSDATSGLAELCMVFATCSDTACRQPASALMRLFWCLPTQEVWPPLMSSCCYTLDEEVSFIDAILADFSEVQHPILAMKCLIAARTCCASAPRTGLASSLAHFRLQERHTLRLGVSTVCLLSCALSLSRACATRAS